MYDSALRTGFCTVNFFVKVRNTYKKFTNSGFFKWLSYNNYIAKTFKIYFMNVQEAMKIHFIKTILLIIIKGSDNIIKTAYFVQEKINEHLFLFFFKSVH